MKEISDREEQYLSIVNDILEHDEFMKTKDIMHHGMNRYDHSVRVSYYSYKLSKMLKLDYRGAARAGLLHDFFLVDNEALNIKEKLATLVNHPKYAVAYSSKFFELSDKEKDMILTHMFPIAITKVPKYMESWVVDTVDNAVSICEALYCRKGRFLKYANVMLIVILNYLKF